MVRPAYSHVSDSFEFTLNSVEVQHLMAADDDMQSLIQAVGEVTVDIEANAFMSLARAIVDQQISISAARAIWGRLEVLCGGVVTPEVVLSFEIEELREVGLSRGKSSYIQDLSRHVVQGLLDFEAFEQLDDETVIESLVHVKGIGRWTAQMYLIFALKRLDVFALDDGGLRRSVCALKGLPFDAPKELIEALSDEWAPYRTVASLYLWRGLGQGVIQSL